MNKTKCVIRYTATLALWQRNYGFNSSIIITDYSSCERLRFENSQSQVSYFHSTRLSVDEEVITLKVSVYYRRCAGMKKHQTLQDLSAPISYQLCTNLPKPLNIPVRKSRTIFNVYYSNFYVFIVWVLMAVSCNSWTVEGKRLPNIEISGCILLSLSLRTLIVLLYATPGEISNTLRNCIDEYQIRH